MIVTLCTGSVFGKSFATIACPDSWYAVLRRSSSGITIERRSAPITILSFAISKSSMSTRRLLRRAANSAASLTRFARSAPEKPGVPRAMISAFTSADIGTLRMWTSRICSRPRMSGSGTTTWRSKRPGRIRAGSNTSGRLVAAMTITPALPSKPSISTSNWLSVCSRSSWPPPRPAPRWRPTASISSMNTMHGEACFACSKRSRTRDAPTPTNISTKSEPEIEKDALRDRRAERLELLRVLEELLDLLELFDGLVHAGDVLEADLRRVRRHPLRARLAERHHLRAAALHLVHQEDPETEQQDEGQQRGEDRPPGGRARPLRVVHDAVLVHLLLQIRDDLVARVMDRRLLPVVVLQVQLLLVRVE